MVGDPVLQGASWSSLEYGGQWKMAHYYAEKFFADTLLSPVIDSDMVEVWVVCDRPTPALTLLTSALHWDSFHPTNTSSQVVAGCPTPGAHLQLSLPLPDLLAWGSCHPGSYDLQRLAYCLFAFQLQDQTAESISSSFLLAPPKLLGEPNNLLQDPDFRVTVIGRVNRIMEVSIIYIEDLYVPPPLIGTISGELQPDGGE